MTTDEKTFLKGNEELDLQIFLPPPFNKIPQSIPLSTGNSLLARVLLKMKKGLMEQLLLDYSKWAQLEQKYLVAA